MTKTIQLTQGRVAIVDDEDFEYLNQWKWYSSHGYAVRHGPRPKRSSIFMHKEIMPSPTGMQIDHKNRITLDNRKENLRICTNQENQRNTKVRPDNRSGYKGVKYQKGYKSTPWRARIFYKKFIHIGLFSTAEEAARAYDESAKKYFGEFACLNFKQGEE